MQCASFQNLINGPFPLGVWSCFSRSSDLTNNNQEGFYSQINKELKQIYPTFGQRHKIIKELKNFKYTRYHGGNLFDDIEVNVNTMTKLKTIGAIGTQS